MSETKGLATAAIVIMGLVFLTAVVTARGTVSASAPNSMPGMDMSQAATAAPSVPAATPSAPHHAMSPLVPPAGSETTQKITLEVKDARLEVAPGVVADMWTFNGSVPGPVLHVRQGDTVDFTLINHGTTNHSIDFHAAQTPWDVNYQPIGVGETLHFTFKANYPGVFMYHCGTPPVLMHLAMGMYGVIIVDPANPLPKADKEYVLVQSELYLKEDNKGVFQTDYNKAAAGTPDYVVFNGFANQYSTEPLTANPGERIRLYVMNAGPGHTPPDRALSSAAPPPDRPTRRRVPRSACTSGG